jgi:hypothetical protein
VKGIETGELTKPKLDAIIDEYNECIANRSKQKEMQLQAAVSTETVDSWKELESSIKQADSFEGKDTAIEIINDIKLKVLRNEKVSNFLINGLKEALANQPQLKAVLDTALQTLPK